MVNWSSETNAEDRARISESMSLSEKQRRFVAEYQVDLNATQAAIRAGYSRKTANRIGSRLLTNVDIAEAVAEGAQKHLAKLEITAERVLAELARLAYFDPRKLFRPDGSLRDIGDLDGDTAAAVAAFDFEKLYEH